MIGLVGGILMGFRKGVIHFHSGRMETIDRIDTRYDL